MTDKEDLVEGAWLLNVNSAFFYKKDRFPDGLSYKQFGDLKNYTIGCLTGSSAVELENEGLKFEATRTLEQNFKKLQAGRVDLVIAIDLSGWTVLRDLFPEAATDFSTIKITSKSTLTGLIFLKEQSRLMHTFQNGLNIILDNGTYYSILERYYGKDPALADILPQELYDRIRKNSRFIS